LQIDTEFPTFLKPELPEKLSRRLELGDSIMTAVILAPFSKHQVQFTDLGRLRLQESERVKALQKELTKCGVEVIDHGAKIRLEKGDGFLVMEDGTPIEMEGLDTLEVFPVKPNQLCRAEIETYNDHRMAMCFAILGLKVPGIKIKNPACVKKTFPNFFQKLAAQPPHGLGAEIWEIKNGQRTRKLSGEDLFAE
jgi:3-phosphoshikimate 1-carboxyvinyltransferase